MKNYIIILSLFLCLCVSAQKPESYLWISPSMSFIQKNDRPLLLKQKMIDEDYRHFDRLFIGDMGFRVFLFESASKFSSQVRVKGNGLRGSFLGSFIISDSKLISSFGLGFGHEWLRVYEESSSKNVLGAGYRNSPVLGMFFEFDGKFSHSFWNVEYSFNEKNVWTEGFYLFKIFPSIETGFVVTEYLGDGFEARFRFPHVSLFGNIIFPREEPIAFRDFRYGVQKTYQVGAIFNIF